MHSSSAIGTELRIGTRDYPGQSVSHDKDRAQTAALVTRGFKAGLRVSAPLAIGTTLLGLVAGLLESPGAERQLPTVSLSVALSVALASLIIGTGLGGVFAPLVAAATGSLRRQIVLVGMSVLSVALGAYLVPVFFVLILGQGWPSLVELAQTLLLGSYGLFALGAPAIVAVYVVVRVWHRTLQRMPRVPTSADVER